MAIVTIIIVNYNSGHFLPQCLDSILAQSFDAFEILVIDNASSDDSLESIEAYPAVKVIKNPKNVGFARGQNQGMRLSHAPYILTMNFDILLPPTFLEEMVSVMEHSDCIGSVSPKLLQMDGQGQWTGRIDNAGLLLPGNRFPKHRGGGEQDQDQYNQAARVFGVMGAAALYRKAMLEDIAFKGQYFDESYFMWYEDIDLDWRARLRGWDCIYTPRAVAYHVGDPHGHGKSKFGAQTSMRNRWKMILTNECVHCFRKNFVPLAKEELGLVRYVVQRGWIDAYVRAFASLVRSTPEILAKRRWVRGQAKRKCLPDYPIPLLENE
jgi:GT2 family glycosyltransferase